MGSVLPDRALQATAPAQGELLALPVQGTADPALSSRPGLGQCQGHFRREGRAVPEPRADGASTGAAWSSSGLGALSWASVCCSPGAQCELLCSQQHLAGPGLRLGLVRCSGENKAAAPGSEAAKPPTATTEAGGVRGLFPAWLLSPAGPFGHFSFPAWP